MSRFSRFVLPLLIACAVFTGAVDLVHHARVRGEMRKLRPPEIPLRPVPPPVPPPPPPNSSFP